MDTNSPIEMALMYAGKGWHVFPLHTVIDGTTCDCRRSCPKPGKHPRTANGFKDATTDETQIRKWWGMWPDANIGIATGKVIPLLHEHQPKSRVRENRTHGSERSLSWSRQLRFT